MLAMIGIVILLGTIYCLMKQYETRMVLFLSGLLMCVVAMEPLQAFKGFSSAIKGAGVIETITASMAFAFVMEYTKCDKHLVHLLAKGLHKLGPALIPGAVLVTAFVHLSIPSAAGCVAAVGSVLVVELTGNAALGGTTTMMISAAGALSALPLARLALASKGG